MKIGITERGDAALSFKTALASAERNKVDGVIFITKDPISLLMELPCQSIDFPFIIHCTITGFGGEKIEPNVPPASMSLLGYHRLCDTYGKDRVVLRVDPVLLLGRAMPIIKEAEGRVRISFLDGYDHVGQRFAKNCPDYLPLLPKGFHHPLADRLSWARQIQKELGYAPEICGEPDMPCTGCVSQQDLIAMGLPIPIITKTAHQRYSCKCLAIKTELLNNRHPCAHNCQYCYWKD